MKYKNDIIAVIIVLGFLGLISFYYLNLTKVTDASKFKEEYSNVSEDNVFVYRTDKEIIEILKHGTGIVYLGFPECPWCQAYVSYLDEVAKETKIEKIYYLKKQALYVFIGFIAMFLGSKININLLKNGVK